MREGGGDGTKMTLGENVSSYVKSCIGVGSEPKRLDHFYLEQHTDEKPLKRRFFFKSQQFPNRTITIVTIFSQCGCILF